MNKIRICNLYSDTLNPAGDSGNIKALIKHLNENNIESEVKNHLFGEKINQENFDIFYIGGAQDFDRKLIMEDLQKTENDIQIKKAIESNKTFIAIGAGFELLGKYFETLDGTQIEEIGALDFYTIDSKKREAKNFMFEIEEIGKIVGFENHSGKTYLNPKLQPLGKILVGEGNNGEDKTEGARYKNVFGTYAGGPVLVKNPAFCNYILGITTNKFIRTTNKYENAAHNYMQNRLETKKQASSNF